MRSRASTHSARAVAVAHHRHDAHVGFVTLALGAAASVAVFYAGWQAGGAALGLLGVAG